MIALNGFFSFIQHFFIDEQNSEIFGMMVFNRVVAPHETGKLVFL